FSLTTKYIRNGGTAMFAYLALAGDLGCSLGPSLVGLLAEGSDKGLQQGILGAGIFPLILLLAVFLVKRMHQRRTQVLVSTVNK
ncbi:hypothetical protein K6U50_05660, partial [Vibrio fluvialis]|nr:hypothetical protein [Vibrio fluvialis]